MPSTTSHAGATARPSRASDPEVRRPMPTCSVGARAAVSRRVPRWSSSAPDPSHSPPVRVVGARLRPVAGSRAVGSPCHDIHAAATTAQAPTGAGKIGSPALWQDERAGQPADVDLLS